MSTPTQQQSKAELVRLRLLLTWRVRTFGVGCTYGWGLCCALRQDRWADEWLVGEPPGNGRGQRFCGLSRQYPPIARTTVRAAVQTPHPSWGPSLRAIR